VALTSWLIDKSALVRPASSPEAADWATRIERGHVRIATVTRLEIGYSAQTCGVGLRRPPLSSMPVEYQTPAIEDRSVEVLTLLADRDQHRAPSIPDLIIAATAELAGLTVLHLDKDFEIIADVTGQPIERLTSNRNRRRPAEDRSPSRQLSTSRSPASCGSAGQHAARRRMASQHLGAGSIWSSSPAESSGTAVVAIVGAYDVAT
jgi:predicted nucleic acid-binding protein